MIWKLFCRFLFVKPWDHCKFFNGIISGLLPWWFADQDQVGSEITCCLGIMKSFVLPLLNSKSVKTFSYFRSPIFWNTGSSTQHEKGNIYFFAYVVLGYCYITWQKIWNLKAYATQLCSFSYPWLSVLLLIKLSYFVCYFPFLLHSTFLFYSICIFNLFLKDESLRKLIQTSEEPCVLESMIINDCHNQDFHLNFFRFVYFSLVSF